MSNGRTDEMIGPQEQLRVVPLLSYNLQKFIGSSFLFISKKVSQSLPIPHGMLSTIRCPCD